MSCLNYRLTGVCHTMVSKYCLCLDLSVEGGKTCREQNISDASCFRVSKKYDHIWTLGTIAYTQFGNPCSGEFLYVNNAQDFRSGQSEFLSIKKSSKKCGKIDASFNVGTNHLYFLSGAEFVKYNFYYNTEEIVAPLKRLGISSHLKNSDAAFTDFNGTIHILKRCRAYSFRWTDGGKLVENQTSDITTLGLPCSVDAALNTKDEIIVIKGCQEWLYIKHLQVFTLRGNITDRGLPCHIDAAVEWTDSSSLYIKGVQYWKYYGATVSGPFHTDLLHLCSWNLCGEREWMNEKRSGSMMCNGDARLCPLKLNQVTLAGLHNAGAGYYGGFGLMDCFLRNHGLSITDQLLSGIRHLDIDPCYDQCGLLGSCHSISCGGGICPIIKQLRSFLRDHQDEVVTLNFNHEIKEPEKVFPALNRQLNTQLGPMLNNYFRKSSRHTWPKLGQSIRTNKRVFVFYAPIIERSPHEKFYLRYKWIHSENFYGTTWQEFFISDGCHQVVNITRERCESRRWKELIEVSIVPTGFMCIRSLAEQCRPFYQQSLRACEKFRFVQHDSPNVLLVGFPEEAIGPTWTVFQAVNQQNVRNIYQHRGTSCYVKVNAAVQVNANEILFFSGPRIITYSVTHQSQIKLGNVSDLENIDAAYVNPSQNVISVIKGCDYWEINSVLLPVSSKSTKNETCDIDAAVVWKDQLYIFKDCNVTIDGSESQSLNQWGLPCSVDTVLLYNEKLYIFKGNQYWSYNNGGQASPEGQTLDWNIDVVHCKH
ncbi:hypothetical protein Btru_062074 [Bulinus truncatus]|nr:hypothetical protein Btru_062074 [Bulinus truncatus]